MGHAYFNSITIKYSARQASLPKSFDHRRRGINAYAADNRRLLQDCFINYNNNIWSTHSEHIGLIWYYNYDRVKLKRKCVATFRGTRENDSMIETETNDIEVSK